MAIGWSSGCDAVLLRVRSGLGRLAVMIFEGGVGIRAVFRGLSLNLNCHPAQPGAEHAFLAKRYPSVPLNQYRFNRFEIPNKTGLNTANVMVGVGMRFNSSAGQGPK